ncbi:MAG: hypothetical protein FPO08_12905 [Geobacter sp.]|nr:MAG: hypothetical protein FPO08_12905 [Geobacter sp.]
MQIQTIKDKIVSFIANGTVGDEIIAALYEKEEFIPSENSLWDYKETIEDSAIGYADLTKDIACFYNSFGGYLIFGVKEEEKDKKFVPVGFDSDRIRLDVIKGNIKGFIDHEIEVVFMSCSVKSVVSKFEIGILYIPKRPKSVAPICFKKNSPEIKNKSFFHQNETWYRRSHACVKASKSDDFSFLFSSRDSLSISNEGGGQEVQIFQHNLPDKNLICPSFIGRENILKELWEWLGDDFAYSKVLAGDGGEGKTSIAYEFARQVSRVSPCGFKSILWLTAKEKQFYGFNNQYRPMPQTDYQDVESLLQQICLNLGFLPEEVEGVDLTKLKRFCKEGLKITPSFVVVDDIDSTDQDEQKRLLETALQISDQNSRFLLTARSNLSYSSDLAINVPGLDKEDFKTFVSDFCQKVKVAIPKGADVEKLRLATDGSPLLTESIIRLIHNGYSFEKAIKDWEKKAGKDARNFVLKKEVERLSPEQKEFCL